MEIKKRSLKRSLKSISRFTAVLIVLCILPSGAFASENKPAFTPAENLTDENFADVQAEMLESISEQIAELQSFYNNVSEVSNASELQEVLASHVPAHGCGPDGMRGPEGIGQGPCGLPGLFNLNQVENVTDDNYTDVQTEIVDSIGNITEMLNSQLENTTDENKTEMLNEQITELETLSNEISAASSAEELQNVIFTHAQTQAVDVLEMKIEHLEEMQNNMVGTTDENLSENLSSRVTELNTLKEEVNGAESLEDLMEILSSSEGMPGMGFRGPMQHGDFDCPINPGEMPENNADNSTEA